MNKYRIAAALLLTALTTIVTGCSPEKTVDSREKYANVKFNHTIEARELGTIDNRIVRANNSFAFKYLKETLDKNTNVVTSPLSLTASLAYLQNGADGKTKKDILEVLGLSGVEDSVINNSYRDIIAHLNSSSGVEVKIGNSIWIADNMKAKEEFKNIGKSFYEADVEEIRFSKKNSRDLIDDWVIKQTAGNMISGMGSGALPATTKMMLFSTVCFRGKWKTPFNNKDTEDPRYSTSSVAKMRQTLNVDCLDGDNFTAVRLPYEDVNYGMYIFLPDYPINVNNFLKGMNNDAWEEWMQNFTEAQVKVSIPRFGMGHGIPLDEMLKSFGLNSAFAEVDNYSKISEDRGLLISGFKQTSFININEAGTLIEVQTSENRKDSSEVIGLPIEFDVNRAFAYAVVEKKTGLIIVIGKIEHS
jgi:serine protease inhibitor